MPVKALVDLPPTVFVSVRTKPTLASSPFSLSITYILPLNEPMVGIWVYLGFIILA